MFGLVHIYQGIAGIIGTGLLGLIAGSFYIKYGRVWPLIISHALYDSVQIILALIMIR
jgi:membrane protease YdiL (CAAX protease family)